MISYPPILNHHSILRSDLLKICFLETLNTCIWDGATVNKFVQFIFYSGISLENAGDVIECDQCVTIPLLKFLNTGMKGNCTHAPVCIM